MHNAYRGGTPDVWYSGPRGDLWVEYKWATGKKLKAPALSSLQLDWITKRRAEGRNVAVIVGTPRGAFLWMHKNSSYLSVDPVVFIARQCL